VTNNLTISSKLPLLFKEFASIYTIDTESPERERSKEILKLMKTKITDLVPSNYYVKGSVGMGTPTPTPWIGIRDTDFTINFRNGIYIFYSFPEDMSALHLAIGQGTDGLKEEVGAAAARLQLTSNAASLQHIFKDTIKEKKYSKKIYLKSTQNRASSYEDSVVIARNYNIEKLPPEEELIDDLKNIIDIYPKMVVALNNYSQTIKINNDASDKKLEKELTKKLKKQYKTSKSQEDIEEMLENLTETDSTGGKSSGRNEQQLLRQLLFQNEITFKCAICREMRPVNIMVAGHIKPRTKCTFEEKTDPQIVMPICKVGCDELFEKGYLIIDSEGYIKENDSKQYTSDLSKFIKNIVGNKCEYFNEHTSKYFQYKYDLVKNKQ